MAGDAALNLADYYLFDRLDEGLGDKDAILFGEQRHSYADVANRTEALAAQLLEAGLRREQRVLTILYDSPAFAWSFFATLRAGGVVAMGNPVAPAADLKYLTEYTRAATVITHPSVADAIADTLEQCGCHLILVPEVATGGDVLGSLDNAVAAAHAVTMADAIERGRALINAGKPSRRTTHADDIAIWLFTSGSTGKSKAALHSHRDFVFNTERYAVGTVAYQRDDITVSVPRLFFGYATGTNLMFPFRVGATSGLFTERPTPASLADAITRYQPTIVTNVPTMMAKLLDDDDVRRAEGRAPVDMSQVRFHLSAGEALPPALLSRFTERFGAEVYDGIGSAEMFHIYCSNRPGDVKPGALGKPVDGYEIKLLPAEASGPGATPVPMGEIGVMWVKGDSVAHGYFQDREKSWDTFFGHWCRSGDLFREDADGYFWFEGRSDDLLKVGGVWVAPVEVERCLDAHASVSAVAVIGADLDGLIKPKAFVVVREELKQTILNPQAKAELAEELKAHVRDTLSKHKYPRRIAFVDDLPKNDRGKIDRKTLNKRELSGESPDGL